MAMGSAVQRPAFGPGDQVGTCELIRPLGCGGQGQLWEAFDAYGRAVAVKVARAGGTTAAERESALQGIASPGLVEVLDAGLTRGGRRFVVYRYVDGLNLADLLAASAKPLTHRVVCGVARDLCRAVDALHDAGFLHLDIKPSNILISRSGEVLLGDYGCATWLNAPEPSSLSIGYCSPEQLGSPPTASRASDRWAVAVVVFEMLNGTLPFSTRSAQAYLDDVHRGARKAYAGGFETAFAPLLRLKRAEDDWAHAQAWLSSRCGPRWRSELRHELAQCLRRRAAGARWRIRKRHATRVAVSLATAAAVAAAVLPADGLGSLMQRQRAESRVKHAAPLLGLDRAEAHSTMPSISTVPSPLGVNEMPHRTPQGQTELTPAPRGGQAASRRRMHSRPKRTARKPPAQTRSQPSGSTAPAQTPATRASRSLWGPFNL